MKTAFHSLQPSVKLGGKWRYTAGRILSVFIPFLKRSLNLYLTIFFLLFVIINFPALQRLFASELEKTKEIAIPQTMLGTDCLFLKGQTGEWYFYAPNPGIILHFSRNDIILGQIDLPLQFEAIDNDAGELIQISDWTFAGGMQIAIVNGWTSSVFILSRNLQPVKTIELKREDVFFEPVSIASLPDGSLVLINRYDREIWRYNISGALFPFAGDGLDDRIRNMKFLRFSTYHNRLFVLTEDNLISVNIAGNVSGSCRIQLSEPDRFCLTENSVWIAGAGLEHIPLQKGGSRFELSEVVFKEFSGGDLMCSDGYIYFLSKSGDKIDKYKISGVKTDGKGN